MAAVIRCYGLRTIAGHLLEPHDAPRRMRLASYVVYVVNDSAYPFVAAIVWGDCTHDDLARMKTANTVNRERGRHVSLIDGRRANMPDAAMRRAIADLMKGLEAQQSQAVVCSAVIIGSTAAIGVLTALQWLAPPKQPLKYFSSAVDAYAWMRARAAENALTLPDAAGAVVKRMDDLHAKKADPATFVAG
jgi:hypothetical protein